MKRLRVILLTLALTVSMLAPEFAMLPAAYAGDTAAAQGEETQVVESGAETEAAAGIPLAEPGEFQGGASNTPKAAKTAYDRYWFTLLDDEGAFVVPAALKDKIEVSHTKYGNGVLLKGKVKDLNKLRISINKDLVFDKGAVGRLDFDGLRDKDSGMQVSAQVYLDNAADPAAEFALPKQMGKKEWSSNGEKTVSMAANEVSGMHKMSIGFSITGKDESKKTSIAIRSVRFCKTTIPVMYFNIDEREGSIGAMNSSTDHSAECYGTVDLIVPDSFNADTTFRDEYGPQETIKGLDLEYIRGRGNSTWTADKKPYKVKFDKAQDLFGFGKNKHWTLLANRFDNSLVRNRMTYWLGQQLGLEFTPQCAPVEVVMNGEFYGSYLLCEQIRVGTGRVTIDDLDDLKDAPSVTDPVIKSGGYLLSMEYDEDTDHSFTTKNSQFYIESPDDNAATFKKTISDYMQTVEDAIMGEGFKGKDGTPYTDYLDMSSAVDYWWVQEFSENGDAYGSGSTYLYKKRDSDSGKGKLYWGPLWDFDFVAWGDLDYEGTPDGTLEYTSMPWFEAMKSDPAFIKRVKTRWSEKGGLKSKLNYITKKGGLLDKYKAQMETSYDYDHEKWGPNESVITEYSGEIEQLRSWIKARTKGVNGSVAKLSAKSSYTVRFVVGKKTVKKLKFKGGTTLKEFPKKPSKKGYIFRGWFDPEYGYVVKGDRVSSDLTLTADFVAKKDVVSAKKLYFKNYDVYYAPYFGIDGEDEWYYPEYRLVPEPTFDTPIKWFSSDKSVAEVNKEGNVKLKTLGEVTITAKLKNGVKNSYRLHLVSEDKMHDPEGYKLSKTKLTLKEGAYTQLIAKPLKTPCYDQDLIWISTDDTVASVDEIGVVTALSPGTTDIMAVSYDRTILKCRVTVKAARGSVNAKYKGSSYRIVKNKKGVRTAILVKARNVKNVSVPAAIKYRGKNIKVTVIGAKAFTGKKIRSVTIGKNVSKIRSGAFKGSKVTAIKLKTKKLGKASVKGSLKGSKVRTVTVKAGKKKVNRQYARKYRKIFTKKNAGRKVIVK